MLQNACFTCMSSCFVFLLFVGFDYSFVQRFLLRYGRPLFRAWKFTNKPVLKELRNLFRAWQTQMAPIKVSNLLLFRFWIKNLTYSCISSVDLLASLICMFFDLIEIHISMFSFFHVKAFYPYWDEVLWRHQWLRLHNNEISLFEFFLWFFLFAALWVFADSRL